MNTRKITPCTFLILITAIAGIILGLIGFQQLDPLSPCSHRMYEVIQMFLLNKNFESCEFNNSITIRLSAWLIFFSFLLFSSRLILKVLLPKELDLFIIRYRYKRHYVICGLNELSINLIKKSPDRPIVVITSNMQNQYTESLKQRKVKVIQGDPNDKEILKLANIKQASRVYVLKSNDETNVEIAYKVYSELQTAKRKITETLKCFVLIENIQLKRLLLDSPLFSEAGKNQQEVPVFDGIPFNITEAGIHYSVNQHIDIFLNKNKVQPPKILILGLGKEAENLMLRLAHGLTVTGDTLSFVLFEEDKKKIETFKKNYTFLDEYANIDIINQDYRNLTGRDFLQITGSLDQYSSICFAYEETLENLICVYSFIHKVKETHPPIIVFCNTPESIANVMNIPSEKDKKKTQDRNVLVINTFEETFEYLFELDERIEVCAARAHEDYRQKHKPDTTAYELLSEKYKQSNRDQVLDYFYKMYLMKKIKLNNCTESPEAFSFTVEEKELLAQMEHRRWCIEKLEFGWAYNEMRNDGTLAHTDIVEWSKLSTKTKEKDIEPVNLMQKNIKIIPN